MTTPVTVWDDGPGDATPVVLVHGTLTWATQCYAKQRPPGRRFRLLLPDRRGFGAAPDLDDPMWTNDYAVDARDVLEVLGATGPT